VNKELALSKVVNKLPTEDDLPMAGQTFEDAQGWTWYVTVLPNLSRLPGPHVGQLRTRTRV
jgi:hypothetical protein